MNTYPFRKALELGNTMDSLGQMALLLQPLTQDLEPKVYYSLYTTLFDELQLLQLLLLKQLNIPTCYQLVQYCTGLVVRLYMMITVSACWLPLAQDRAEILLDILEMCRGVVHPTRGLFIRYYLLVMTRQYLETDHLWFLLGNFVEMNKLWVRMQFMVLLLIQGPSAQFDERLQQRKDLRLLVGTNLVRIGQLENLTVEQYRHTVLPAILQEVVSSHDQIAQEYLMDVIIQVFPDEFHLETLDLYLDACSLLEPTCPVHTVVIGVIERFSNFAIRQRQQGLPMDDDSLFGVFWSRIQDMCATRIGMTLQIVLSLLQALTHMALETCSNHIVHVDLILGMALEYAAKAKQEGRLTQEASLLIVQLLSLLISHYAENLDMLRKFPSFVDRADAEHLFIDGTDAEPPLASLSSDAQPPLASLSLADAQHVTVHPKGRGSYTRIFYLLDFDTRRKIAHKILQTAIKPTSQLIISTPESLEFFFGNVANILVADQIDGDFSSGMDCFDMVEEQLGVAKWMHAIYSTPSETMSLLIQFRSYMISGGIRIAMTLPTLVSLLLDCARRDPDISKQAFQHIYDTVPCLLQLTESEEQHAVFGRIQQPNRISLELYLYSAQVADEQQDKRYTYEFFVQVS